jgi:hypothetical protein
VPLPKVVAKIYKAIEQLKKDYPGRHFTPDGHLIGSIGEVVARETFRFDLYPASTRGHDARCPVRGDVQVKTTAGKATAVATSDDPLRQGSRTAHEPIVPNGNARIASAVLVMVLRPIFPAVRMLSPASSVFMAQPKTYRPFCRGSDWEPSAQR